MNDFHLLIAKWFRQNSRQLPWRETKNPYFIWLSEIILQQTQVKQGLSYYQKFTRKYPTVVDLANANEQDILNDWQGLGYYSRARNLHFSAKYIRDERQGEFPNTYNDIIQLKGVGKYTAAAISSFAFNERKAVVDGNVYRLLSRVFNIDTPIDSTEGQKLFQKLADSLISKDDPATHNQAIMEMGATVCTPASPDCLHCPLQDKCLALAENTIQNRPVKSKKTKVRNRYFHYFIYENGDQTVITQRTEKDIWQNMYQFPLVETTQQSTAEIKQRTANQTFESQQIIHKLSHQHIHAVFHHFNHFPDKLDQNHIVIAQSDIQEYPLPRIIDRYLEGLNNF